MPTDFADIVQHTTTLKSNYAKRNEDLESLRKMFHMEWTDKPIGEWVKATLSPSAFNSIMGAVRLMTSTEPQFSAGQGGGKDRLERAARSIWSASGRISLRPPHYDIILSGLLFGEIVATVSRTSDLLDQAEGTGLRDRINRARYIAHETPYFIEVHNPMNCYPDRDALGLRGLLRTSEETWGEVYDRWGSLAEAIVPYTSAQRLQTCVQWDWYDWGQRCVWIEGYDKPIYHEDHKLPMLPIGHGITEGSMLFTKPEQQRFSMLYPLLRSGLWQRENLSLTTLYTLIFALASNPILVHETNDEDPLVIDRTVPGGLTRIKPGDKLSQLAEKVIDPAQQYGLDVAERYSEQSTISKQALGAQPKSTMAFSAISLLVQAGRLPLMGVKQVGGQTVASLLNIALRWLKEDRDVKLYAPATGEEVEISPDDIPERLVLTCNLEPDLPTDKLNLANVAQTLVASGLASNRWVRENILSIGQSDEMDHEIWDEKRVMAKLQERLTELAQMQQMKFEQQRMAMAAQAQAAIQPPAPAGQPAPAAGPGGPGQVQASVPPNGNRPPVQPITNRPPGGQVAPGAPLTGPNPQSRPGGPPGA